MYEININKISGRAEIPSSKNALHRMLICAYLADGKSVIHSKGSLCDDVERTALAIRALGGEISYSDGVFSVARGSFPENIISIDCGGSATTLRLLIPVCVCLGIKAVFTGDESLISRPVYGYSQIFGEEYVSSLYPIEVKKGLPEKRVFRIRDDIRAQYASGMIIALPLLSSDSRIVLSTPLSSAPYIFLTEQIQKRFLVYSGIGKINSGQTYKSAEMKAEGDMSSASFIAAMAAVEGDVVLEGLNRESSQGDRVIFDILCDIGASVKHEDENIHIKSTGTMKPLFLDISEIPDLFPTLAFLSAAIDGKSIIVGINVLKRDENQRLKKTLEFFGKAGVSYEISPNKITIEGKGYIDGGFEFSTGSDYRIAMAAFIASMRARSKITIDDIDCINKSYPDFIDTVKKLSQKRVK